MERNYGISGVGGVAAVAEDVMDIKALELKQALH